MSHLTKWEWYDMKVMQLTEEKGTEGNYETKDRKDRLFIIKIWDWYSAINITICIMTHSTHKW